MREDLSYFTLILLDYFEIIDYESGGVSVPWSERMSGFIQLIYKCYYIFFSHADGCFDSLVSDLRSFSQVFDEVVLRKVIVGGIDGALFHWTFVQHFITR